MNVGMSSVNRGLESLGDWPDRSSRRHAAHARHGGFTLVELLIVMALVALGAGLGIHSFRNYREGQRARAAAAEVVSVLTLAKGRAAAANRPAIVDFAPGGLSTSEGFFLVYLDTDMDGVMDPGEVAAAGLPNAVQHAGMIGYLLPKGIQFQQPSDASVGPLGLSVVADGVTFTNNAVTILPDGTAPEAGHVTLEDGVARQYAVTVTAGGAVRRFRYDGSGWQ